MFFVPKCAAGYVQIAVLTYDFLFGQDPCRKNICNIDLLKQTLLFLDAE